MRNCVAYDEQITKKIHNRKRTKQSSKQASRDNTKGRQKRSPARSLALTIAEHVAHVADPALHHLSLVLHLQSLSGGFGHFLGEKKIRFVLCTIFYGSDKPARSS
jgi:hypothetical protein